MQWEVDRSLIRLWHKWFAWFPVCVVERGKDHFPQCKYAWLDYVERRVVYYNDNKPVYDYREIKS